jgi:biopolymer transport protein ExbB
MLLDFEPVAAIRTFLESGGDVLFLIAAVTFVMWMLMLERIWYFWRVHPRDVSRVTEIWRERSERDSYRGTWYSAQERNLLISEVRLNLGHSVVIARTLIALCPMLGLLGTVTGMIEVFDVMAIAGSGNARGMAGGVSKATLPTMAGMVAALSGLIVSVHLERRAKEETRIMSDRLAVTNG